jgi:SnoaL-like polyketide cyclase
MTELHDRTPAACSMDALSADERDAALVRRVVDEIWNAGNIDLADHLFSSTYINHGGLIPDLVAGPEGIKFSVALFRTAFPELRIDIDSLSSIGGSVHMRWTASNVERGFSGETRCTVAGGQIVESWTSWDSEAALLKLQALAQPGHEESS